MRLCPSGSAKAVRTLRLSEMHSSRLHPSDNGCLEQFPGVSFVRSIVIQPVKPASDRY